MNCTFTFGFLHSEVKAWDSIAQDCIQEVDRLEALLSRYREDSELSMLNKLSKGESMLVHVDLYECLYLSMEAHVQTGGVFDVTLGHAIDHAKESETVNDRVTSVGQLALDEKFPRIYCVEEGSLIDFGGIGKGYALDKVRMLLEEYQIDQVLLSSGASTHLIFGGEARDFLLAGRKEKITLRLSNQALSSSSLLIQGEHIVPPAGGAFEVEQCWCVAADATTADVWSTAGMLLPRDVLLKAMKQNPKIHAFYRENEQHEIEVLESA